MKMNFPLKRPLLAVAALFLSVGISACENRVGEAHRKAMEAAAADTVVTEEEQRAIDANRLKNLGIDESLEGNHVKAAEYLAQAIKLTPDDHNLWYQRGLALNEAGKYNEAFLDLTKAIQLNPQHANTYKARGQASLNLGNYDAAISDMDLVLSLSPREAQAYVNRGIARIRKGQKEAGCEDFGKAEALRTLNVSALKRQYCGA